MGSGAVGGADYAMGGGIVRWAAIHKTPPHAAAICRFHLDSVLLLCCGFWLDFLYVVFLYVAILVSLF